MTRTFPTLTEIPEVEAQDPYVLSPDEQAELLSGHPWSRFAILGDSVAFGMGDPSEGYATVTWGERIAAALAMERDDIVYENLARHRAMAAEIRDEQLGPALEFRPDLVAVVGGGNDVLAEDFDVAPVKAAIDDIVVTLTDAGTTVITYELVDFGGAFPDPALQVLGRRLEALYAAMGEIARDRGTVHVDMFRQPWAKERYCFSSDLKHPTMRAQALAASATVRALGEHLRQSA